jgi:penicillin amidase
MRSLLLWLAGLLLLAVAGLGSILELTLPRGAGRIEVAGPESAGPGADVEIGRDLRGVVTIRASSEADAAFAIGFAHAQDRLFQMDLTRRLGAGRLSEIVGPGALATDQFMRRLGLARVAEANYRALPDEARRLLDAYAAGVNAYLARADNLPAPELLLLGYRPEPWHGADCLIWGRLMAWQLSANWSDEKLRSLLAASLPAQTLAAVWPLTQRLSLRSDESWLSPGGASNNWVVDGAHSVTGKPLLANDPHLGLTLPGTWYLARFEIGRRVLAGVTAPGVPLVLIGRNDHLAWGFTTADADTQDIFVETLLDDGQYATPDGPRPLARRQEVIRVRGSAPVTIEALESRHGPLLETDQANHRGYALAWEGLRTQDRTAFGLLSMSRATTAAEFRAALRDFESPVQDVVYADDSGGIGFIMAGRIPVRAHLLDQSEMPVPGDRADDDWISTIPFDGLPQGMNSPEGYFATANNRVIAPGYPYFIAARFDLDYRIDRIRQLIAAAPRHSLATMQAMQMDDLSLAAQALTPLLLAHVREPALAGWDGRMDRGSAAPLVFLAWLRELARLMLEPRLGADFPAVWSWDASMIAEALGGGRAAVLCDDPRTPPVEDCAKLVIAAHERALGSLTAAYGADRGRWRWGDAHRAHFPNSVLSRLPVIGAWFDLDLAADGDYFTVDRGVPRIADPTGARFDDLHGASLRAIFDLGAPDRSLFVIAGGQSGNPVSAHYADFTGLWQDGRYVTMVGADSSRLRLVPAPAP